jgi:putative hydrolase of the HAD superfamily
MQPKLGAVAFDLDGTLYPNYRLNIRLIPFILRHFPLLLAFGRARDLLRGKGGKGEPILPGEDFYTAQARLMAAALKSGDPAATREQTFRLIYRRWECLFSRITLYPHVRETLETLGRNGLKLALLSDFPPEEKLRRLDLADPWDLILCSEVIGSLKPGILPFRELSRRLDMEPSRILYVGNSVSYDIRGAKAAGFKAALISPLGSRRGRAAGADFVFFDYRKLTRFVLG